MEAKPAIGFIRGFGFKSGAIAGSIAHDSHNIICVGTSDTAMVEAINFIVEKKGGIAVHSEGKTNGIEMPVAGIMSDESAEKIACEYKKMNHLARDLGSTFKAPFMTLSFMALLVIPELKISDKGLFDVSNFTQTSLFV